MTRFHFSFISLEEGQHTPGISIESSFAREYQWYYKLNHVLFLVEPKTFYSVLCPGRCLPGHPQVSTCFDFECNTSRHVGHSSETGNCLTRTFAAVPNWTPLSTRHDHVRTRRIPVGIDDTLHHNASIDWLIMRTNRMTSFRKHILCTNELGAKPRIWRWYHFVTSLPHRDGPFESLAWIARWHVSDRVHAYQSVTDWMLPIRRCDMPAAKFIRTSIKYLLIFYRFSTVNSSIKCPRNVDFKSLNDEMPAAFPWNYMLWLRQICVNCFWLHCVPEFRTIFSAE